MNKYHNIARMYNILERDTNDLGSIIHFHENNLGTFGLRIYILLFMSCNLFEVIAKEIEGPDTNMNNWKESTTICKFSDRSDTFIPMNYELKPLEALGEKDVNRRKLTWWDDYNSVKHDLLQIDKATLKNLIHALYSAGVLVGYLSKEKGIGYFKKSALFEKLFIPSLI